MRGLDATALRKSGKQATSKKELQGRESGTGAIPLFGGWLDNKVREGKVSWL